MSGFADAAQCLEGAYDWAQKNLLELCVTSSRSGASPRNEMSATSGDEWRRSATA